MNPQVLTTMTSASAGILDERAAGAVEVAEHHLGVDEVLRAAEADESDPRSRRRRPGTGRGSRVEPVDLARVGDRLAQVRDAADPGDAALDPHAEAGVRDGAVLADVEVPLERLDREAVLADPREQQVVVVDRAASRR